MHGVSDCARLLYPQAICAGRMLPSRQRTRSAPRNSTRFAARYPARGLPCERFTAALASRNLVHHSGPGRLARRALTFGIPIVEATVEGTSCCSSGAGSIISSNPPCVKGIGK